MNQLRMCSQMVKALKITAERRNVYLFQVKGVKINIGKKINI